MEPKFSSPESSPNNPQRTPESLPNVPNPETAPEAPLNTPEAGGISSPERAPEQAAQAQAAYGTQPAPISLPTPVAIPSDDAAGTATDDLPAVAADEDLIEKEWVDKAKQIISETRDDPARREREVGRLQSDYLKKRYGKELGAEPE